MINKKIIGVSVQCLGNSLRPSRQGMANSWTRKIAPWEKICTATEVCHLSRWSQLECCGSPFRSV